MSNDDEKYYFAVKSKLESYSSEWLRSKKQSITNGDNCFQDALNDALDYQRIKKPLKNIKASAIKGGVILLYEVCLHCL